MKPSSRLIPVNDESALVKTIGEANDPENPDGKSAASMMLTFKMSEGVLVDQPDETVAGGEAMVIVAPISPGLGALDPSVNPYVTEAAWTGMRPGASVRATTASPIVRRVELMVVSWVQ
jgi:hypothetical protein